MHLCLKLLCWKAFCTQCFFVQRWRSLTVRAFWRAEELRWELRRASRRWERLISARMRAVEKNLLRWHLRRDGMRWEELRWGEKKWDEMKCEVCAGCEECSLKCEESVRLALRCKVAHAGHVLGQQQRNRFPQSTQGPSWRTARASSIGEKTLTGNFRPASCGYYWYYMISTHVVDLGMVTMTLGESAIKDTPFSHLMKH